MRGLRHCGHGATAPSPIIVRVRLDRPALLLATLAAALAGGGIFLGSSRVGMPTRSPPPLETPAVQAALEPSARGAPAPPRALPRAASEPRSARVDRLGRSADPVEAFGAYALVTDCLWARDHADWLASHIAPGDRGLLPTTQTACGDIASDQVQARLRWLERAAGAGVHHAATAMAHEGPDGLGLVPEQERDGPQYADWRQRLEAAYDAGVRTCDPESLDHRVNAYETGAGVAQDRAKALSYWIAWVDCRKRFDGAADPGLADGDGVTRRIGAPLGPDEVAAAVAAGHRIAREARPLPGDS
jgi:hypothetical protein